MLRLDEPTPCPRCSCPHTVRWGHYPGGQRYRCRGCGRSFSASTATPYAYSKLRDQRSQYLQLMQKNATLREIAASLGIHPSTAFRWRHAILRSLASGVALPLSGLVEVGAIPFAVNEKGRRDLGESARRRGGRSVGMVETGQARTQVIVAVSIDAGVRTEHLEYDMVRAREVRKFLDRNVAQGESVVPAGGYWRQVIALASRQSGYGAPPRPGTPWVDASHLQSYRRRLRRWLACFRGVGTGYLAGYLRWHQSIEAGTLDSDIEATLPSGQSRGGERTAKP